MGSRSRSRSRERHQSSRSGRRRSRSRSRDRGSKRSRSRSPDPPKETEAANTIAPTVTEAPKLPGSDNSVAAQMQAMQLAQLQQQQLQRQLMTQQLLMQQQMASTAVASSKKQREVYVGNLTIGVVTADMLRELFNAALSNFVPDPVSNPPVVSVTMDPSGRFGFVECRTEDLATAAMQLDKVELCGRHVNVGRPKGYIEGAVRPPDPQAVMGMAQAQSGPVPGVGLAASTAAPATQYLYLENLLLVSAVRDKKEREELSEEVKEECENYGTVQQCLVPKPPRIISDDDPCRVYVKFGDTDSAKKAKTTETVRLSLGMQEVMDGRQFAGNRVTAKFVTEEIWGRAEKGEWVENPAPAPAGAAAGLAGALPAGLPGGLGAAGMAGLPGAMPGLPNMAGLGAMGLGGRIQGAMPTAGLASLTASMGAGMPFAANEGWLKLRGLPFSSTKADIQSFFFGCGTLQDPNIKIVIGTDGRPSGEAFVEFRGPDANVRAAMARDRQIMPNSTRYVEIFPSSQEEVERKAITGCYLI